MLSWSRQHWLLINIYLGAQQCSKGGVHSRAWSMLDTSVVVVGMIDKGGGVCSLGYDPHPTPSLLRVGMKLLDLLQTAASRF
jgi:hypothetical protein